MLDLFIFLLIGILAGVFTGLIPGIHINLISTFLIASLPFLLNIASSESLVVFIVSMSITHTFIDFIPSIYLGAPDTDTFLSILPGHQMLINGEAHKGVILTLIGSISALPIILALTPLFIFITPKIYPFTKSITPFLLIFITIYLSIRENKPLTSLFIIFLSGFLGFATLNLPIKNPLFPLLTGLFGTSALIISIRQNTLVPEQNISKFIKSLPSKKENLTTNLGSILTAPLVAFLPGIGAGHAAVIASEIINQSQKGFLILVGAINTIVMGLSFVTFYSIGRIRTGSAAAVNELIPELSIHNLITIIFTISISGIISSLIAIQLSKIISKKISSINYKKISLIICIILTFFVILFSNSLGFLVYITSTALGIFVIESGSRRINMMGVLLIPTILFYLF